MLGLGWEGREFVVMPIALLINIVIAFIVNKVYKNDNKDRELPLQAIAIIVVILEIAKQIRNIITGFSAWSLPLHYCSLFVFFFPLAQFGTKRFKRFFKPVAFACALTVSCALYTCPGGILGGACENVMKSFSTFHTFVFHELVVLYTLVSIVLNDYVPKKDDYKSITIVLIIYSLIAITMGFILDTNYCNYLYSVLDPVEEIRLEIGQFLYTSAIFIIVVGGTSLVSYLYYLGYNSLKRKEDN